MLTVSYITGPNILYNITYSNRLFCFCWPAINVYCDHVGGVLTFSGDTALMLVFLYMIFGHFVWFDEGDLTVMSRYCMELEA